MSDEYPKWLRDYAADFAKRNNVAVTIETQRDGQNRHWGRFNIKGANSGLTLTTIDYKRAKAAGFA